MRSGLIVVKAVKKRIPDEFLLRCVETHSSAAGFAVVGGGEIISGTFVPYGENAVDVLACIQRTQDEFLNERVFFWFGKMDVDSYTDQSLQPFQLIESADGQKNLVAAMIEGDLSDFEKPGTDEIPQETAELNFALDILLPEVDRLYTSTSNNLKKLAGEMNATKFKTDMKEFLKPRANVLLLNALAEPIIYTEGSEKTTGEWDWGFATRHLDYDQKPAAAAAPASVPTVAAKPMTFAERAAAARAKLSGEAAPALVPEPEPEKLPVSNPPAELPQPDVHEFGTPLIHRNAEGVPWVKAEGGASWDRWKAFWNQHAAIKRPDNPQEATEGFPASALKKESPLYHFVNKPTGAVADALATAEKKKTEQPLRAEAQVDKNQQPLVLPADQRARAKGVIAEDEKKNKDKNLADIIKAQEMFTSFTEQTAIPLSTILRASTVSYGKLGLANVTALANQLRMMIYKDHPELFEPEQKVEEAKAPTFAERAAAARAKKVG